MRVMVVFGLAILAGCVPSTKVVVLTPPSGYLEPCYLPPVPEGTNPELADAFVEAYRCAEIGNRDKQRISEWAKDRERRFQR